MAMIVAMQMRIMNDLAGLPVKVTAENDREVNRGQVDIGVAGIDQDLGNQGGTDHDRVIVLPGDGEALVTGTEAVAGEATVRQVDRWAAIGPHLQLSSRRNGFQEEKTSHQTSMLNLLKEESFPQSEEWGPILEYLWRVAWV